MHFYPQLVLTLSVVGLVLLTQVVTVDSKIIDLTHKIDKNIPVWPGQHPLHISEYIGGDGYSTRWFSMSEHTGTHIDAPFHFSKSGWKINQIDLDRLIGPGVLVDLKMNALKNPNYRATLDDLLDWERTNGRQIPPDSIVLFYFGWSTRWNTPYSYLGSNSGDSLRFPGLSKEAAGFLANNRSVAGVGLDTASVDSGDNKEMEAHKELARRNVFIVENMNMIDSKVQELPAFGFEVYAVPINLMGGTGAPSRVFAVIENHKMAEPQTAMTTTNQDGGNVQRQDRSMDVRNHENNNNVDANNSGNNNRITIVASAIVVIVAATLL